MAAVLLLITRHAMLWHSISSTPSLPVLVALSPAQHQKHLYTLSSAVCSRSWCRSLYNILCFTTPIAHGACELHAGSCCTMHTQIKQPAAPPPTTGMHGTSQAIQASH
ncbi:hypothetical protein COO60DRAFT_1476535 [Scenedesmus sp. NREL 46B-D3]|nr:hypothetical protein COO60DRAFT_1476535 [Scenedesmus sp. NREL 46B-D3]